jgi:HK97 family phage major capsid protein
MSYIDRESREKRAGIVTQARALISKSEVSKEDHDQFDAMMVEADALNALATKREQAHALEAEMNEVIVQSAERFGRSPDQERDMQAVAKGRFLAHLQAELCREAGIGFGSMTTTQQKMANEFRAALGVGTSTAGGNTVEVSLQKQLYAALKAIGSVRSVADVFTTATGGAINFITMDDTSNTATLVAEGVSHGVATDPVTGVATMNAYKMTTGVIPVSIELIQDSVFDVESWVNDLFVQRMNRGTNAYYTTGTGSNQPQGILTAAPVGVTAGSATALTADNLIDLQHSVDPDYRTNSAWMFNDAVTKTIRKLKDSTGQLLWQENWQLGAPATLFGRPVVLNQNMPSTLAINALAIATAISAFSKFATRSR